MKDAALSEAAMLASLRDIHLPPEASGGVLAEVLVSTGLAGFAAVCVVGLLRLLSARRVPTSTLTPRAQMAALSERPEGERRVALLHLLRTLAPDHYAAIRGDLYRPDGGVTLKALEAEVARLV